mmetsp:Transcript_15666/g.33845  ORF Transcript_15666/g.33845 Transcript_15666/m.33845 type:complete len:84 (+) Transcript_15666:4299-4550(+)
MAVAMSLINIAASCVACQTGSSLIVDKRVVLTETARREAQIRADSTSLVPDRQDWKYPTRTISLSNALTMSDALQYFAHVWKT